MLDTEVHAILLGAFLLESDVGQPSQLGSQVSGTATEGTEVTDPVGTERVKMTAASALDGPEPGVIVGVVIQLGRGFNAVGPDEV
jgi:hypothetical protein